MRPIVLSILSAGLLIGCSGSSNDKGKPNGNAEATDKDMEYLELDEGTFTVDPGKEATWCVRIPFPKEFRGRKLGLMGWGSDLPKPTHHFFMSYSAKPVEGDAPVPCNGTDALVPQSNLVGEFDPSVGAAKMLFGAGTGKHEFQSSRDYGRILDTSGSFVTNHHVLNLGTEPAHMYGRFRLAVKDAALVVHPVSQITCNAIDVKLPAGQATQVTATCLAPFDMDIVLMSSHAHARLTKAETRFYDGTETKPDVLYTSTEWDSPKIQIMDTPLVPVHLKAGQGLTYTCYYQNASPHEIDFGLSANDEMCVTFDGFAYPPERTYEVPPTLFAPLVHSNQPATATDSTDNGFFF